MKPDDVKLALFDAIQAITDYKWLYSVRPGRDNTRSRKFPFKKMLSSILAFRGGTLNREIMDFFGLDPTVGTSSAFIQQRAKILPEAFESLFRFFVNKIDENKSCNGFRLLAVDGSDLQIAANPNDPDSYFPGINGQKAYNLLHINAMYDLLQHTYVDAIVQKRRYWDESGALVEMVDRADLNKVLLLADRGYESYNVLAHIQEKGWCFLIRIRDNTTGITSGLTLPDEGEYDIPFHLDLTRRQTNSVRKLLEDRNRYRFIASSSRFDYLPQKARKHDPAVFFGLSFRIVRFLLSNTTYETIITNLNPDAFPLSEIKRLYAMRWGIETSFRDLKYTLGLCYLHSKKTENILQEVFAKLTMYNFAELITSHVVVKQKNRKYPYRINFAAAVHICRNFFLKNISPPVVEALLLQHLLPIRNGVSHPRGKRTYSAASFLYRIP